MVDVDDGRVRSDVPHTAARTLEVPRIEEEHELRLDPAWRDVFDVVEARQELVHRGQRRRDEHPYVLARGAQRLGEREAAAQRVAVSVLVTKDQDLLVGV